MIQIKKGARRTVQPLGIMLLKGGTGWLQKMILLVAIIAYSVNMNGQALKFIGTTPENGSTIESLENIIFHFDLTDVINTYGEGEWGVCCNGFHFDMFPQMEKSIVLYKGTQEDGEELARVSNIKEQSEADFQTGNNIKIDFPTIAIESREVYTAVVTYDFYAGKKGEASWEVETKYSFNENPITLTFYGASETKKIVISEYNSIDENSSNEQMPELKVSFNYDIAVNSDKNALVYEGKDEITSSNSISVDPENNKGILVKFPETTLYNGHSYNIVIPAGTVNVDGENDAMNEEIIIPINGASYRYFGIGRVRPSDGSETVMDEIVIPFKFPTAEDKTYGFVNVDNGNKKWYIHVYEGASAEGEELMSLAATKIGDDNQSLIFRPNYAFKPETEYTLVIPEGDVLAYEIGALRETYLKDYISERVELHYTTPSVESLPKWNPVPVNVKDNDEVAELKYFIIDNPPYEYGGTQFFTTNKEHYSGRLYLVTDDGEQEIAKFPILRKTLNQDSEIGNGQLIGQYNIGEVNATLYEGNLYRLVWLANTEVISNTFIGQFIGNPEISVTLKGATPTSDDFGLKANVDDRLHSHADVFSFVTESEINAGEGATMKLMDGEENVAEAPVYVSREANSYRVYADFGGKKLENGKSYDVVLPEGSVFAPNGIVNNPEIKSTINAIPEPEEIEFVKVTLNFDNSASASYQMVKGAESGFMIQAEGDRQIESVTADDKPLSPQNGIYTVSALNDDTDVAVTLVPLPEPEIPEPVVPDYYDVTLLILNGEQDGEPTYTVAQTMAVEEGKAVSFSVEPADEMWKVGEVMNATEQEGKWITAPLDGNLEVTVTFSLASPLAFDFETAVNGVVDGCEYQVYSDGDGVRIENVKGGDRIRVYSVGGAIMGDLTVGGNMDSALIHLAPGTYIIAINSTTIKFLHK